MFYIQSLFILCSLFTFKNNAQEPIIPLIKHYNSFFIDTTGTLDQSFIHQLNNEAQVFENIGFQVAGFFANTTNRTTVDVATEFGNKNGIGFQEKDNGIAIAIFLEKSNNAGQKPTIGVAIGKGLEGLLNDAKVGRLLDETFVKKRIVGKWQEGLLEFIQTVNRYLKNPQAKEFAYLKQKRKDLPNNIKGFFLILLIIALILWLNSKNNRKGPRKRGPSGPFFIHPGSGFRGGGFGGGGGGGFGGGGAGR